MHIKNNKGGRDGGGGLAETVTVQRTAAAADEHTHFQILTMSADLIITISCPSASRSNCSVQSPRTGTRSTSHRWRTPPGASARDGDCDAHDRDANASGADGVAHVVALPRTARGTTPVDEDRRSLLDHNHAHARVHDRVHDHEPRSSVGAAAAADGQKPCAL